jgi:hypothetical protein
MWHVWGRGEMHMDFWGRNLRGRDELKGLGIDRRIILKWIFKKLGGGAWTGLIWLRIRTSDRLL